jgi:hypothetical protein
MRAASLVAACAVICGACGTVYHPESSARITLVIHGGGASYLQSGRETPIGPLGGALEPLVAGDADAVGFARRARHELAFGVPAYVCGIAALVVGLVIAKPAGWALAGAGAASGAVGIGLMGAGAVNAVDAVNVYNDHVAPRAP